MTTATQTRDSKITDLVSALDRACKAAVAASQADDGGTCNFDSATLTALPVRLTDNELATLGLSKFTWFGRNAYWVNTPTTGQGDNRTRCAKAACDSLVSDGYEATMYYQMD